MGKIAGYKAKVSRPLPSHPVIVICLPGDGYIAKFCVESLITSTSATVAQVFSPFNFPPRIAIEGGMIILQGYQLYVGAPPYQDLVIISTDLRIQEIGVAAKATLQLASYLKNLQPKEILILDGCAPDRHYKDNNVFQIRIGDPQGDFWLAKRIPAFKLRTEKDKYFLFLAVALQTEDIPARALICETSGKDVDPDGAKMLLELLKGHPAFPAQFDYTEIDIRAAQIREDIAQLAKKEKEKEEEIASQERSKKQQDDSNLHYIQ